jgi:dihydrofolate reductase
LREEEVMVIGGAEVYRALLPFCDRVLLTEVRATYPEADVRLGTVADITHGLRCLSRETLGPDESTPVSVVFSEWVRD